MRVLAFLVLAACWRSSPAPVVATAPPAEPPAAKPSTCRDFDAEDPACARICHHDAPDDWAGCEAKAAELMRMGYACTHNHPRTCGVPSAARPAPIMARVIGIYVRGSQLEVTISSGRMQGVSTSWKATLMDAGKPVPNGTITLTRVEPNRSIGTMNATTLQVQSTPTVRLEP